MKGIVFLPICLSKMSIADSWYDEIQVSWGFEVLG